MSIICICDHAGSIAHFCHRVQDTDDAKSAVLRGSGAFSMTVKEHLTNKEADIA